MNLKQVHSVELLINGDSRRSRQALRHVLDLCKKYGIILTEHHIIKGNELDMTLEAIKQRSPSLLIVGSGDGTLSHLVNYFVDSTVVLGIIPLGTTNNFARSLNVPLDIEAAVQQIAEGEVHEIDLGYIKDTYFANVAGIGVSANIAGSVNDVSKRRYGRFVYAVEGLKQLMRHKPFTTTVEDKDGELQLNFETHQVIVANGRFHAGRQIAVDASLASRELIIFALGGRSKWSFVLAMLDFYLGKRKSIRHASFLVGKDVQIKTSTPQRIELDGEVRFYTPCSMQVRPGAIRIKGAR